MDDASHLPLQVGDSVAYEGFEEGLSGVVVNRLDPEYLLVLWRDMAVPTTHRYHSLRRLPQAPWGQVASRT